MNYLIQVLYLILIKKLDTTLIVNEHFYFNVCYYSFYEINQAIESCLYLIFTPLLVYYKSL